MKNKIIIASALVLLVVVSFAFTTSNKQSKTKATTEQNQTGTIGGLISENKI